MSLSEDVRNELAAIAPERDCDRLSELSALFHTAGSLHLRGRGEVALHLDVGSAAVARRAFSLLRDVGIHSEIRTYRQHAFGRPTRYQLHVQGDAGAQRVLREAGVLDARSRPLERPPRRVVAKACCRGAYLRGALLGGGSVSAPRSAHVELRSATVAGASFTAAVAGAAGVHLAVRDRGRHAIAYAKGAEAIEGLLAIAGAGDAVLALEERAVVTATRADANRLANADHANISRTSRAAEAQVEAVRRLRDDGTLSGLPERLQTAADVRLRHPTLSLRELAGRCDPPVTKASLHRRLTELKRLAGV